MATATLRADDSRLSAASNTAGSNPTNIIPSFYFDTLRCYVSGTEDTDLQMVSTSQPKTLHSIKIFNTGYDNVDLASFGFFFFYDIFV